MAQKRMLSLKIVDTDEFLDMPPTTQNLYFHLCIRADDDGFVSNPKKIMKIANSASDDMKVLISKSFVIPFNSGVCVIKHWKIHNFIRSDRYTETEYKEEKELLIEKDKKYELSGRQNVIPTGNPVKIRLDEISKDMSASADSPSLKKEIHEDITNLFDYYKQEFQKFVSDRPPIFSWGACERLVKPYLRQFGKDRLMRFIDYYLRPRDAEDKKWFKKNLWSLSCLLSSNSIHRISLRVK